jgi:predicted ATPase with chaperone activity
MEKHIISAFSYVIANDEVIPTIIECQIEDGIGIHVIGLMERNAKEVFLRNIMAISSSGYNLPEKKITLNIQGMPYSGFRHEDVTPSDLALVLTILFAATKDNDIKKNIAIAGALDFNGNIHKVKGIKEFADECLKQGKDTIIVPLENYKELKDHYDDKFRIMPVTSVSDAIGCFDIIPKEI